MEGSKFVVVPSAGGDDKNITTDRNIQCLVLGVEDQNSRLRIVEFAADGNSSGLEPRQQEEVQNYYQHDNQQ